MPDFRVESYADAAERATAVARAAALSAIIHKLRGGDRLEPIDLGRTPLTPSQRTRAQARRAAGQLGRTTGHSAVVLAPTDPDAPDDGGEVRCLIDQNLEADLATYGGRLTEQERTAVAAAIAAKVER